MLLVHVLFAASCLVISILVHFVLALLYYQSKLTQARTDESADGDEKVTAAIPLIHG